MKQFRLDDLRRYAPRFVADMLERFGDEFEVGPRLMIVETRVLTSFLQTSTDSDNLHYPIFVNGEKKGDIIVRKENCMWILAYEGSEIPGLSTEEITDLLIIY